MDHQPANSLLIFDFDGVVADSEVVANDVLAKAVSALGVPTSLEDSYSRYMGRRFPEVLAEIERVTGRPLPDGFPQTLQTKTLTALGRELKTVTGFHDYLAAFPEPKRCIASSSSPDRLALCLEVLGLRDQFEPHIYSASLVARGKPAPDIFLYAAEQVGVAPSRCLVLEDSPTGVEAATAAGMTVIGLTAASHIQESHAARLAAAGAHHVAESFAEAAAITRRWLSGRLEGPQGC